MQRQLRDGADASRDAAFSLAAGAGKGTTGSMAMEFGWWRRDPEVGKFQVLATVHGGSVRWTRKQGHHQPWTSHAPTDEDWDRLLKEAGDRVPRRLISLKQFEEIRRLRER